jgi:hypothetical protein
MAIEAHAGRFAAEGKTATFRLAAAQGKMMQQFQGALMATGLRVEQPSFRVASITANFTAWWGLTASGKPEAGETLVVSAPAGAVGSVAGQAGRLLGCRGVGVAGGSVATRPRRRPC